MVIMEKHQVSMQKGSLNMTDRIQSINDTTGDRADLNVGGRKKNKRLLILLGFIALAIGVLGIGIYIAVNEIKDIQETESGDNKFLAGSIKSSLKESDSFFLKVFNRKNAKDRNDQKNDAAKLKNIEQKEIVETSEGLKEEVKNQTRIVPARITPKPKYSVHSNKKNQPLNPEERKMIGNVLINVSGGETLSKEPVNFSKSFNSPAFEKGSASLRSNGNLDFLLVHGTFLPCALYTQIISDFEGFITCRITQDVYSANGVSLLIEKGSVVSGTQSVALEQGKSRIFTSWADIETPLGVSIRIDSLGTGQLGASGIDAWVDNHFKQRFGGAILLSFVDDALGALSRRNRNNNGFGNSINNGRDIASKALENSINIRPTGYAFIGQRINILVARDIDMSSVYSFDR